MVDMIVELENNNRYLILDETMVKLDRDIKYYFGLRLDQNEEPTNNYLFFEEINDNEEIFLCPVVDEEQKNILLTTFTVNFLDKIYDEV